MQLNTEHLTESQIEFCESIAYRAVLETHSDEYVEAFNYQASLFAREAEAVRQEAETCLPERGFYYER